MRELDGAARLLAAQHNYSEALVLLDRGLESWPGDQALVALRAEISAGQMNWLRDQSILERIRLIEAYRQNDNLAEALTAAEKALDEFPDQASLLELRDNVRKAKALGDAHGLIDRGDYQAALEVLRTFAAEHPKGAKDGALAELSEQATRAQECAQAVRSAASEALSKAEREDYDGALLLLDGALKRWPNERAIADARQVVLRSKNSWKRQRAISDAVRRCEELESAERLDEAVDLVFSLREEIKADPRLIAIAKRLEGKRRERDQRKGRNLQDIQELIDMHRMAIEASGSLEAARMLEHTRGILARYPDDEAVRSAGDGALEHLGDIIQAADKLANGGFDEVLRLCDTYLTRYPNHIAFAELKVQAEDGVKLHALASFNRQFLMNLIPTNGKAAFGKHHCDFQRNPGSVMT